MDLLSLLFVILTLPLIWNGALNLLYIPLALAFEIRRRKAKPRQETAAPLISIIVPGYNEGRVLRTCVESILASRYPNKEIILVNDGSTDDTLAHMQSFAGTPGVTVIDKPNGGKASALNAGLARAQGEYIFCVDADGMFTENTIAEMLRAFDTPDVGAVCGSDAPVNLDRPQTHLAAIQTHVGTGFVRRALSFAGCLPIVSGNIGAFRRAALQETGGFREGLLGEDLELTWRIHRAGYQVRFAPDALVLCETPSTIRGLWKQRVRWARGLLQTAALHRDMIGNPYFGPIGPFLALNLFTMIVVPVLQISALIALFALIIGGNSPIALTPVGIIGWAGLLQTVVIAVFALALDRAWHHARYLYAVIFWLPYSFMLSLVMMRAIYLELRRAEQHWNKLERVGLTPASRKSRRTPASAAREARRLGQQLFNQLPRRAARLRQAPGTIRRISATATARRGALGAIALVCVLAGAGVAFAEYRATPTPRPPLAPAQPPIRAIGIDLVDMTRPASELAALEQRMRASGINMIGLTAGRVDWTSFRWEGRRDRWSNDVRATNRDLLADHAARFADMGHVSAIVDVFAPRYLDDHPSQRAIGVDGRPLLYQASTSALVEGRFGDELILMIAQIARDYPVDSITLTELFYYQEGYGADDLALYRAHSGRNDWPRTSSGAIDPDDASIAEWRSAMVARFVARAANAAQVHGKELFVDVRIGWDTPASEGRRSGHDYALLLEHADRLVLWNYFGLNEREPEYSREIASYMQRYGAERIIISYGLWASRGAVVPAEELGRALDAGAAGSIPHAWITPSSLMTDAHWEALDERWEPSAPRDLKLTRPAPAPDR